MNAPDDDRHWSFRRDGTRCTDEERRLLFEDRKYQGVALTTLPDGSYVSTVWLGINHQHKAGKPPLIFESLYFGRDHTASDDEDLFRYTTEAQAIAGHQAMVRRHLWHARVIWLLRLLKLARRS